ncbi:MAG: DUF6271 family protein [Candidatus Anammoxibacter sp.]
MNLNHSKCVTIIPTIYNIAQSKSIECYVRQMIVEDFVMPICLVDNSDTFATYELNRKYINKVRANLQKKIPVYHFGIPEQESFFKELIRNGVDNSLIEILKTTPGYGASRNRCFLLAKSIGAESIFFFDDDTRPHCNIFKKHFDILGTKKGLQKISVVSGPYKGARGVDFSFIKNRDEQMRFLEILGHHGESSLNYLKTMDNIADNVNDIEPEDKTEPVRNIRGGNFLIDKVYEDIVCPTIKRTPGVDDTFVARRVIEKGYQVIKSQIPVIHEHFKSRRNKHSILQYIESWAGTLAFEARYDGASRESTVGRVLRYGKELYALECKYCKLIGGNLLNREYAKSLVNDIDRGLDDYRKLNAAWKFIMDVSGNIGSKLKAQR